MKCSNTWTFHEIFIRKTLCNFLIFFTFCSKIPTLGEDTKRIKAYFLCIVLIILFSTESTSPKISLQMYGNGEFLIIQFTDDFYQETSQFQNRIPWLKYAHNIILNANTGLFFLKSKTHAHNSGWGTYAVRKLKSKCVRHLFSTSTN